MGQVRTISTPTSHGSFRSHTKWNAVAFSAPNAILWAGLSLGIPLIFFRGFGVYDDSLFLKYGEMVLGGAAPYRDFVDYKPPGIFYLDAAIAFLGQGNWLFSRLIVFLFSAGFALLVLRFALEWGGKGAAWWVAWIFPPSYYIAQGYSLHTEAPMAFFGLLSVYVTLLKFRKNAVKWALAGALAAVACLFKQPGVLYLLALEIACVVEWAICRRHNPGRARNFGSGAFILALGFSAVLLLVYAAFALYGMGGLLFKSVVLRVIPETRFPYDLAWACKRAMVTPAFLLTIPSLVLCVFRANIRKCVVTPSARFTLLALFLCGSFATYPTLKSNAAFHYLQGAVCFLALFNAFVLSEWQSTLSFSNQWKSHALVCLVLFSSLAVLAGGAKMIYDRRLAIDLNQQKEIREVLDARTAKSIPVLALTPGATARLYLMSGRRPLPRHIVFYWPNEFSYADAVKLLHERKAPTALLQLSLDDMNDPARSLLNQNWLFENYDLIHLKTEYHPLQHSRTYVLFLKSEKERLR